MSEGDSWLRQPVEPYSEPRIVSIGRAVAGWWRETTDVVILNSPWLKRSTGRALRCIWVCFHLGRWLMVIWCDFHLDRQHRLATLRGNWWMQLVLMLMLVCFAYVLYLSTATNRDGFWVSFLLCVGILLSLFPPETLAGWNHDDIGYAFVTLCHCNVHPASLCLVVVVSTVSKLFCRSPLPRPGTYGTYLVVLCNMTSWPLMGHRFHTCLTECLLLAAFTMDFSNRIQAVATGILYGCESDSTASALLQSPVAGRSGRQPCWLAGFFSWIWWLIDISFDRFIETDAEQLQVALSFCLLFPLVCGLSAYSWRKFHALGADIVLGILCHTPAALKSVELIMGQANPSPGSSFFSYPVVLKYQLMHVLATQTLVQAGCHPGVCAAFTLPLCVFALWEQALSAGDLSKMDTIHVQLLTGPLVCLVLICSHFIDYFSRMKAIREGFASSAENARTREHLAAPGVELSVLHLRVPVMSASFVSRPQSASVTSTEFLRNV